jgi:hypothetical protein
MYGLLILGITREISKVHRAFKAPLVLKVYRE